MHNPLFSEGLHYLPTTFNPNIWIYLVPGTRIELVRYYVPRDFKSLASTYSATQALWEGFLNVRISDVKAIMTDASFGVIYERDLRGL